MGKGGGGEMVTARLLTNCSNTLRNIHTNARENITRTRAKRKAGYFFMAHSVFVSSKIWTNLQDLNLVLDIWLEDG